MLLRTSLLPSARMTTALAEFLGLDYYAASMGRPINDITGVRYGKLVVIGATPERTKGGDVRWLVRCDCGAEKVVPGGHLRSGGTRSCGCLGKHGMTYSSTYKSWNAMKDRCTNPNNASWEYYGGRGITLDDSWNVFINFFNDMGERPPGTSLDRIDNDGNYEPGNCRWASSSVQGTNRRGRGPNRDH